MLRPRQYVSKSPRRVRRAGQSYGKRSVSIKRTILGVLLAIFDFALLGWLSFKLWGVLCTDPEFAVRRIHVQGVRAFSYEEVVKRTGLAHGQNIFKADIRQARRNLEAESLFRKVEVWRQFPKEILIKITEREPLAQIKLLSDQVEVLPHGPVFPSQVWLVDHEGVILSDANKPSNVYTTISIDLKKSELRRGNRIAHVGLIRALKALEVFSGSVLKKLIDLELIDVKDETDVILKNESGLLVHLGEGDYESRLIRLLSILEDLKKKNQEPLSVDLRFRYVPVVLKEVEQNKSA